MFCRLAAQELSLLSPRLSRENVRLIGIGLEELGVEEFVEKKFWVGGIVAYNNIVSPTLFIYIIFYFFRVVHR